MRPLPRMGGDEPEDGWFLPLNVRHAIFKALLPPFRAPAPADSHGWLRATAMHVTWLLAQRSWFCDLVQGAKELRCSTRRPTVRTWEMMC